MKTITWNSPPPTDKHSSEPFPKAVIVQSWLKISPHVAGRAIPVFSTTKYERKGTEKKENSFKKKKSFLPVCSDVDERTHVQLKENKK